MSLSKNISILNKKAKFEYNLLQRYIAGIQLTGTEIKSIRNNNVSISDSYCVIVNSEIWIKKMHIAKYDFGSYNNHLPERDKKLLLKKIEITKIEKILKNEGLTLIPIKLFINSKGLAKIEISVAKGRKLHDKRQYLRDKSDKIKIQKLLIDKKKGD